MSRVIVKNLPKYINKDRIKQLFSVYGTVTDTRMIYAQGDVFRRIAFIGYSNEDEAQNAVTKMNQTYVDTCKIGVELAKSVNDDTLERPWSRYSKQSSSYLKSEKDRIERLKIISEFKNKEKSPNSINAPSTSQTKTKKLSKHETIILETCGISTEDHEQFNEYMMLNGAQPIQLPQNNDDKRSEITTDQPQPSSDVLFTAKLSNLRPNVKLNRLLDFFKGLDVIDIRILPLGERKKTCVAYADFSNEPDGKKAIKMSGKLLKGNTIKIVEANNVKDNPQPRYITAPKEESVCKDTLLDTGRIFVTNLPCVCDVAEVKQLFENYGPVVDIIMPTNKDTSKPMGYAFVTYMLPENAVTAFNQLNNFIFKGRLLRLIPANSDEVEDFINGSSSNTNSYKLKKLKRLKQVNANMTHTWNTLFINQNTVANILSKRLDISKEQLLLDPSFANNPAVSIAAGETALVNETKNFLESNGVNLDSFGQMNGDEEKSDCILLAKNLPENVTSAQLMEFILSKMNSNEESDKVIIKPRIIMPPYGVTAIIKYEDSNAAKHAFRKLAFTRFRFTPLYLEWAPKETLSMKPLSSKESQSASTIPNKVAPVAGCVVFIKNLNPSTTEETIKNHVGEVVRVTLARKNPNDMKESLGYGFIEFNNPNDAKQCVKMLQGCVLDDSAVELKLSDRTIVPKAASLSVDGSSSNGSTAQTEEGDVPKILVKNIPFEATRNDIMELFKTYGNVKSVRLPQKLSTSTSALKNQHRGFAFIEFLTLEDAKYCFECMRYSTHLYGRRLVLEWANDSTSIGNIRKRTAAHFNEQNLAGKDITSRITETLDNL